MPQEDEKGSKKGVHYTSFSFNIELKLESQIYIKALVNTDFFIELETVFLRVSALLVENYNRCVFPG